MSLFYQRQCHGCGQPCDGYHCESCMCPQCGMTLFNGICDNCIYGAGMLIICTECGGIVRGGLCLSCDLREKDLYNFDPNAYSFDNSNYFSQSQDENYLCNLCGNNSQDGYNCQQQFSFVYEQEPSYNQNYDDNYYPHESLSFSCCDYCGGSHETFQCQPDNQYVDFFGSNQIQTLQYPDVNPPSPEIKYDQSTRTDHPIFLNNNEDHPVQNKESPQNSSEENVVSKTNQEPPQNSDIHQLIEECFVEVPEEQKQNMEKTMFDLVKICHHKQFLRIHDDVDDLIESALDSKLILINSINSQRLDKKQQKVKIVEEQLAESRNRIEKSLQNFRVIHKSSISLNTSHISSIHEVAPILSTRELENSLSMGYEHLSITPEMESNVVTESNAKNLLPILSECEVTLEDKRECDELICEDSSTIDVCDNHSEILFDSNNDDISVYDDDLSSDDESLEDIEYVDASVPDPAIVSVEEENVVQREEEEVDLEDISQVQDVVLHEKLFSITRLISNIESLNDNSTPDCVFNSFEFDNSLIDNYSPEFETFCDNSEETRSDDTTHVNYSLPEYDSFRVDIEPDQEWLINLVLNDISDSSNDLLLEEADLFLDDNSIPPGIENIADDPEGDVQPPNDNFDWDPEVISAVMEDNDEPDEYFNPGGEIFVSTNNEDVDYFPFMFVIRIFLPYLILPEISPLLLSAESEDTIFDPGISE
nr:hypothetical protein [Tanacetum cinerariifolium]